VVFEDELKPGRCFTDDQIERFVRVQADEHRGMHWPEVCAKIADWANVQRQGRYFQEADYQFLRECLHARSQRHNHANEKIKARTGRVGQDTTIRGNAAITRHIGAVAYGVTAHLERPKPEPRGTLDSGPALPPGRGIRGPSRWTKMQRAVRREHAREMADKSKLPAVLSKKLTRAQHAAMSVVVFLCLVSIENGRACTPSIAAVADLAKVSRSSVKDGIARGERLGIIQVTDHESGRCEFRIIDPRILAGAKYGGTNSQLSQPESENFSIYSTNKDSFPWPKICPLKTENEPKAEPKAEVAKAKLSDHHTPKVARDILEPEEVAAPPVQDEGEEIRQEAVQEADAEMERDEAKAEPLSPLEAVIAQWRTYIVAKNPEPTDPDAAPS
jgi:hypothetical protein